MNFEEQKERYLNDPKFHKIVSVLYDILQNGHISIYELQGACNFAINKFVMENGLRILDQQ